MGCAASSNKAVAAAPVAKASGGHGENCAANPDQLVALQSIKSVRMEDDPSLRSQEVSMHKIVTIFYSRVLEDPDLKPFFRDIDMAGLARKQAHFMDIAFGGLTEEEAGFSVNLRQVHKKLLQERGLNTTHFDKFVGMFEEVLVALDIPEQRKETTMNILRSTRSMFEPVEDPEIVTESTKPAATEADS